MDSTIFNVALVEDDESHAELVTDSFERQPQFRLTRFNRLRDARDWLRHASPDLLLVDLLLPDGRGTELLSKDLDSAQFPVILMTSHGDEKVAVEAIKAGAFDYIAKSPETFVDMPWIAEGAIRQWQHFAKQRQAEHALRRSEEHLRMALEAAHVATWEWTLHDQTIHRRDGFEKLFGLKSGQFDGTRQAYLKLVAEEDRHIVKRVFMAALREKNSFQTEPHRVEHRVIWPDGSVHWLLVQGNVIRNENNEPVRIAGTIVDITARKDSEERLRQTEEQLAHMARLSTMGEMVAGIAHELNQPLYTIKNYAKACSNLLVDFDPNRVDQLRAWSGQIAETANHAGDIISRLRDYVRKTPSKAESTSLGKVVDVAISLIAHEARKNRVVIENKCASNDELVLVDSIHIEQVIVNLLQNAMEATAAKKHGRGQITIKSQKKNGFMEVAVVDNGIGLTPGDEQRIFDAFVTTKAEGMGLGLAISKTIITGHGGKLWTVPVDDGGTEFRFTLRLARQEPK